MNEKTYKKLTYKKVSFSLMIVLVYLLGMNIVVPGVNLDGLYQSLTGKANLGLMLSMTGLSLSRISLFSLGLGPWMSALIFWRVLTVTNLFHIKTLTNDQSYRIKFIISLLLATVQSFTIITQAKAFDPSATISNVALILLLVTGLAILVWLGNLNTQYGGNGCPNGIYTSGWKTWKFVYERAVRKLYGANASFDCWHFVSVDFDCGCFNDFRQYE